MLSKELIKQIKHIQLRAGHMATEALSGEYVSAFKGQGMEFDEVREYIPGDDVRAIDWNVTARMNHPFIKVFREEREMTLLLAVDVSASQSFGSVAAAGQKPRNKRLLTAEMAAVLAFLAIRNNDKVGLVAFSDHIELFIPPKKGRGHVWRIIREVMTHNDSRGQTDLAGAFEFVVRVLKRKSLVFFISDFLATDYEKALRLAAGRHDLVCVSVTDPLEEQFGGGGMVQVADAETGALTLVDTSSAAFRAAYQRNAKDRSQALALKLRALGVDHFRISTDKPLVDPLAEYMRFREKRRRR